MPKEPVYNVSPKSGILTSRTVNLADPNVSNALVYADISARNTQAQVAQINQKKEAERLKAANDAKIDEALEAAAKINLENAGAFNTNVFGQLAGSADLPAFTIKPPAGSQVLAGGKFKLPDGRIISSTSLAAPTQTKAQPTPDQLIEQETKRSRSIIEDSFGAKDPISEDLSKKIEQLESQIAKIKVFDEESVSQSTTAAAAWGGQQDPLLSAYLFNAGSRVASGETKTNEEILQDKKKLQTQLTELKQSQVAINSFKADLQIKKVTTDYLTELKGQGKKFGEQDAAALVQKSKEITANQRHYTRGDELYDDNTYNTYIKEFQGKNDFFDWRHTEMSLGNAINSVYEQIKTAKGPEREELVGVLDQLTKYNKKHESSNKDAYDHYYGGSKQYYKEKTPWKTYLGNQVGGGVTEGLYNALGTITSASQDLLGYHSAAFATRQSKDKYFSADMLQADLDGDGQITEKDKDINGQHQYIGKNVTYTKKDGNIGFIGQSVLGASVRTLAEMGPTLLATHGLMKAGVGMRTATFAPVALTSTIRSYEENRKWFKDKGTAALVSGIQGIIEGATESIVPDISYFMGNKGLGTKALSGFSRKYFTAQTLVPEFTTLSKGAKNFLLGTGYAGLALGKQTLQEGFEEELSMFANYVLDKQIKTQDDAYLNTEGKLGRPQELDDSSVGGFFKSIAQTFVESAAAGLLMSGTAIGSSRTQDRNYMRFNIANNPEQFKAELKTQLEEKKITQDQYNKGILETGRLAQLQEQATNTMMNLVDSENLLQDHDKQYEYFSQLLTRDDLLQKVDYNSLSETEKEEYVKKVESVEKDIDKFENSARQYANMPKEQKEGILAKMVQKNLESVKTTNNPAVLAKNLEAIDDAIQIGEKTGKGSQVMLLGRQQIREALIGQIQRLQTVEDNDNTVFENQLLNSPIESSGESMQISNGVRLAALVMQNSNLIRSEVQTQLLDKIKVASETAQSRMQNLSRREQKKIAARELARVELIHPGTAFNADALELLFKLDLTPEEHSDVVRDASVITAREKEKIQDEDIFQPTEKDTVIDSLIKSFESQPLEVQVENEQGNLETVRNEERKTREMRAIFAIPRSKSKEQAKNRIKSIFKAMGYSAEDINKALEDLNQVFDNQEVTNPGDIYTSYLRFLNPTLLKGLPDKVVPQEDILAEEAPTEVAATPTEVTPVVEVTPSTLEEDELFGTNEEIDAAREKKLEIPEVDPADQVVEVTVEAPVVEDEFDGLEVVPVNTIESSDLVATTPTFSTSSNSAVQGSIMKTISNSVESFNLKLVDMFSFIRETLGESSISTLENIYNNVTEALKTNNLEAIARLKEDYLAVFSGSTFANEQLEYIWKEQYIKGKPDASIPFQDLAYVTNGQFAIAYQGDEVIVTGVNKQTGEMFTYNATVTGKVNESNQIEVKTRNGKIVYIKKSNLQTIAFRPINVRTTFNQINSVMITAVDRTSGEIAKFNSNGERDAQGDTQLNVFAPRENDTMKEVRKNLASGQPISHTLPIHTGARINNSAAYKKGKNSVYLTASVAGIDTSIQTVEPEIETPAQPLPISEEVVKETEAKIKRRDLFDGVGEFSRILGNSGVDSVPVSHSENNGIELVQYANPKTGSVDVIVTGTSENDFVGFYRIYENGKPTNKWSSKFENQSRNKENFKTMISGVQSMLPSDHEYTEKTSISTDGLRVWNQQLDRGYELQYDENGKLKTNLVAINGDAIQNELGIPVNKGNFENIKVKTEEEFEISKKALLPYLEKLGLNESNIYYNSGTIKIDLPILKKSLPTQATATTAPSVDISKEVILSGLRGGFKAVSYSSFDIRSDENVINQIERNKSFSTTIERKGKKYVLVGLRIIQDVGATTLGRDGYSFAMIEDNGSLPSNIVDLLKEQAINNVSNIYPNIDAVESSFEPIKVPVQLVALEQPAFEPEVTTNLSKDELAILSFDVSSIEGLEGATESLDQNTSKEIDDAGSCKIN